MACRFKLFSFLLAVFFLSAVHANGAKPKTPIGVAVAAELEIERLILGGDQAKLAAYFSDKAKPAAHRARAARAYFKNRKPPLSSADRGLLVDFLSSTESSLRIEGAMLVGELKEQPLAKQVLVLAAEDPEEAVRLAALYAARPWTKMTHLYYLEGALNAPSEKVRAEAIKSIAMLSTNELQLGLISRISTFLQPSNSTEVRHAALDAMRRWGRLEWETLKQMMGDPATAESLRIYAIELSDGVAEAHAERNPVLMDIIKRESSIPLAWYAFRRLKEVARSDRSFVTSVAKLLSGVTQFNSATSEMATFLRSEGIKAEYKEGAWTIPLR